MSRCFSFPPPGYVPNGIRDAALIESIKREEEKAKKERKKERKREKKEKKRKQRERGENKTKKHSHKRRQKDGKTEGNQSFGDHRKLTENGTELLEKSSLTEEHENLVGFGSQNSCDSTLNSSKRQKHGPPADGRHNNFSESVIRIRLPVKRQRDPDVLTSKEQPCSSQGRIDDTPQPTPRESVDHPHSVSANDAPQHSEGNLTSLSGSSSQITMKPTEGNMPSSSSTHTEQPEPRVRKEKPYFSEDKVQTSGICRVCPPSVALQFLDLIENWAPDPVQRELGELDDQEWFIRADNGKFGAERCQFSNVSTGQGSSTPWPSACFLPEADVHALPYTIPF